MRRVVMFALLIFLVSGAMAAPKDGPVYREPNEYPILDEIVARRDAMAAERDSLVQIVRDRQDSEADIQEEAERSLRVDWSKIDRPDGPDDFKIHLPHTPPIAQFYTGTCWAFSATSLMESETTRLTGHEVKLSEMWTVYWEYVLKVERWVEQYGKSLVSTGSQSDGVLEVYDRWGAVPLEAYPGVMFEDGRHDHGDMHGEISAWLDLCKERNIWDRDRVITVLRLILDAHLGAPPVEFSYDGHSWTPDSFRIEYLQLHPEDYIGVVSRLDTPFGEYCLLDVPDNWRRAENYLNIPLDDFTKLMKRSLEKGYTFDVGGDNSEPGMDGYYDSAIVPSWDIPTNAITQGAREHRIVNGQTGDDHGLHVVGWTKKGGKGWFLIKDSNRSSRLGEHKGFYFWREEYPKLKMLTILIHKDMVTELMP
jgi:bleomycin hydrolase